MSISLEFCVAWISKAEFLWSAKAERILLFPHLFSSFPNLGIVAEKDDRAHVMLRFFQPSVISSSLLPISCPNVTSFPCTVQPPRPHSGRRSFAKAYRTGRLRPCGAISPAKKAHFPSSGADRPTFQVHSRKAIRSPHDVSIPQYLRNSPQPQDTRSSLLLR